MQGDFEGFAYFFLYLVEHCLFGGAECADGSLGGDAAVFFHHVEGVHAGEDDCDAALAVEPAETPLGRGPSVRVVCQYLFRALRKEVYQAAAAGGGSMMMTGMPFASAVSRPRLPPENVRPCSCTGSGRSPSQAFRTRQNSSVGPWKEKPICRIWPEAFFS